jgi:hypothetical protein
MPPVKKAASRRRTATRTSRRRTATRKSSAAKESAALRRLNKALDEAQDALAALRKEVGTGARGVHKDLEKFIKDARRNTGKLSTALRRDLEQAQKRLSAAARPGSRSRAGARKASSRSTTRRTSGAGRKTSGRSTARRASSGARKTSGRSTAKRASTRASGRSRRT